MSEEKQTTEEEPKTTEATPEEPAAPVAVAEVARVDVLPGMTIRLHERIRDVSPKGEERERIQVFEGIILRVHGAGISRTMTIRKMSGNVGVEKIFPLASPSIAKIEVVKTAKTRRANIGFVRKFKRKLKETWVKK